MRLSEILSFRKKTKKITPANLKIPNPEEWDKVVEGRIQTIHPTILEGENDHTLIYISEGRIQSSEIYFFGKIGNIDRIDLMKKHECIAFAERREHGLIYQRLLMEGYGEMVVEALPESRAKEIHEEALDIIYAPEVINSIFHEGCRGGVIVD